MKSSERKAIEELRKLFPNMTKAEGNALWNALTNADIYLPDGTKISGTMRWWGGVIAHAYGEGNYLNFYCAHRIDGDVLEIEKKLEKAGWKIQVELQRCNSCGDEIERFAIRAFGIKNGSILCTDCLLKEHESPNLEDCIGSTSHPRSNSGYWMVRY